MKRLTFRLNQQSFSERRVQRFQERGEAMDLAASVLCPTGALMQLLMQRKEFSLKLMAPFSNTTKEGVVIPRID